MSPFRNAGHLTIAEKGNRLMGLISIGLLALVVTATWKDVFAGDSKTLSQTVKPNSPEDKVFVATKTFAVGSDGLLDIDVGRGSIEITTAVDNTVTVETGWTVAGEHLEDAEKILKYHDVQIAQVGSNISVRSRTNPFKDSDVKVRHGDLEITADTNQVTDQALHRRLRHMSFRILVPREYNVAAKTGGGKISIADLSGEVQCQTCGGRLQLGQINGPIWAKTSGGGIGLAGCAESVDLRTSGGSINVGDVQGSVRAHTSGGSIRLGQVHGRVTAITSGGNIKIASAAGGVEAKTSGGSVSATVLKQPKKDSHFSTSGGNINIELAKQLALDVDAVGSRVSGPFIRKASSKNNRRHKLQVRLNGGGPKLVARNSGGNIKFRYTDARKSGRIDPTSRKRSQ